MTKADATPKGKKDFALYEKKKLLQRDLSNNFVPDGGNMTVLKLEKRYVSTKRGIRRNTEANYKMVINIIVKEVFGQKRIDKVKLSDAKAWLIKL